jgi:hypothetical protein
MSAAIAKAMDISANKYSLEEYFALEKQSDIRHEFVNGNLIPNETFRYKYFIIRYL